MALSWNDSGIIETSSVGGITVASSCAFSACGWCTGNTSVRSPFGISNSTTTQFELLRRAATNTLNAFGQATSAYFNNLALPASASEWWFWAFRVSGTAAGSATLYLWTQSGGWVSSNNVNTLQAVTPNRIVIGGGPISTAENWIGQTSGFRIWNAVLSENELKGEKFSLRARRKLNLHADVPMAGSTTSQKLRDYRGNTWTLDGAESGTPTGPTAGWGR